MKSLLTYLRSYLSQHFHFGFYLSTFLFLFISIYLNYRFNFENGFLDSFYGKWLQFPLMSASIMFPFLTICGLMYLFRINQTWPKSKEFWLLVIVASLVIGFQRSFFLHLRLVNLLEPIDQLFTGKLFWYLKSYVTTLIPLLLFYVFFEKKNDPEQNWYGLKLKETDFRPYFLLVALIFIGIGFASFIGDLTRYYPRFDKSGGEAFAMSHGLPQWLSVAVFELLYGINFLNIELFFRGFLVIGFARVLGGEAVMAMVGAYVFLHFGKPMTECISSAFGGYLIGILAFKSNRIWGGVALHIALAWSMELFAWIQKIY